NNLIRFDRFDHVDGAARPIDFETIGLSRLVQSEVDAQIVLSLIARSGLDVACQSLSAGRWFPGRTNSIAVAFGSDSANQDSVIAVCSFVAEEIRSLAVIADHDIQITIVVEIADHECSADFFQSESGA